MILVKITKEAAEAIRSAAFSEFTATAQPCDAQHVLVPLSQETLERLAEYALEDESLSATIVRLIAKAKGPLQ